MYSLVLMMAFGTTATETPALGWRHSGCLGCGGGCVGCFGGHGRFSGCHGCDGGCHGCDGGCHGCDGGCFGHGGLLERLRARFHGCDGGCFGCHGGCFGCAGGHVQALGGHAMIEPPVLADQVAAKPAQAASKARIVVSLPADAQLTIDGEQTPTVAGTRVYATPVLEPGFSYSYTVRAVVVRDGQKLVETKEVVVRPGEETRVNFNPAAVVAQPQEVKIIRTGGLNR